MRVRPSAAAVVVAVALAYCAWLGAHWLRFSYSSGELPMYASRVWDLERELARAHRVPWWTATFQNGSSESFVYAAGGSVPPWVLLSRAIGLVAAGKVLALLAIGGGGVAMFFCARRLLHRDAAAMLAAFVYLFHPQLLARAGGAEHLSVVLFAPLVPLAWLTLTRALDRRRFIDAFACAVTLDAMLWMQPKQLLVELVFLAPYTLWAILREEGARGAKLKLATSIGALALPMAAMLLVPVMMERHALKLFEGDPLEAWQRMYALPNLGALVDRRATQFDYAGALSLVLAACAVVFGRGRRDRGLFQLVIAFEAAAIALGHGLSSVASAAYGALASPASKAPLAIFLAGFALVALEVVRRRRRSLRAMLVVIAALAAFLFVPWFRIISRSPFFSDVRAPSVFFEVPGMFFGALLAGFFVTDVVESRRFASHASWIAAALGALLLVDAFPYQHWMTTCDVSPATLENARATYAALGAERAASSPTTPTANGKVYVVGGRFFHLMGPSWGGPSLVTEAGLGYMAPRGSAWLAGVAGESLSMQRAYFDLVGVKWLVFDKSDPQSHTPGLDAQLAAYRKIFPLDREDDDFAVFRVPHARAYVSGYSHAAIAHTDARRAAEVALALAHAGYALVQSDGESLVLPPEMAPATITVDASSDPFAVPPKLPREDTLTDVAVTRDTDDRIDACFTATAASVAVVDESFYPFWHATLDGRPTPVLRAAFGLMGIAVPAGAHALALTYEPPRAYAWSVELSAVAFFAFAVAAVVTSRRARLTSRA